MYLTKEEEKILKGEEGYVKQKALEIVVKTGEVLEAERLIKITKAHIAGISYKNIGDEGLDLIRELYEAGGRFSIYTTLNPAGMDLDLWREMKVSEDFARKQIEIVNILTKMGAYPTLSCIPYELVPLSYGEQIAWAESNAVLYANSVIGARTNREGGPLVLFEAICGRAPYVGLRIDENRKPTVLIKFEVKNEFLKSMTGLLGYHLGKIVKEGVPYVINPWEVIKTTYDVRLFLAGVGASSSIGLVIFKGISPDARMIKEEELKSLEKIIIEDAEIKDTYEELSTDLRSYDLVAVGCPHVTGNELRLIYESLKGIQVKENFYIFTCREYCSRCRDIINKLREIGVKVYKDTCIVVADLRSLGVKNIVVDSAKAAYYLSTQGYKVKLLPLDSILRGLQDG